MNIEFKKFEKDFIRECNIKNVQSVMIRIDLL